MENKSYIDKLLEGILTFGECYEKICKYNNAKYRYAFEILVNSEIRNKNILNNNQYKKLLDLMSNDDKYVINYISNEYCSEDEMRKLIDVLILNNSKKLYEILNNYNCLKYVIERIDDGYEHPYSVAYAIANKLTDENVDDMIKNELIANAAYKYCIIDWLVYYQSIYQFQFDKKIIKQIYELHKKKLFSRRKGYNRLYNTLKLFEDVVELEQIRIVVNKVYKEKSNYLISELENRLKTYNLNEEDRDILDADIMMLKLVG